MFYDNELLFLQKMLNKCHLQTLTVNLEETIDERIDNGLRKLFSNYSYNESFFDFFPEIKPNTIFRVADAFLCHYIFFELPFCEERKIFIIGPYINTDISSQQVLEQNEKIGLSPKLSAKLEFFYTSLPVIREENHILAMVNTFAEFLWNGSENYKSIDITRTDSAAFIPSILEPKHNQDDNMLSIDMMENRYNYENELIAAVSQGNIHKAEQMMANFSVFAFEKRVPDMLRNIKNYCIIMNTLLRKAAESGGVHPIYLDRVSSDFAKKIEALLSVDKAQGFMLEILRTYCQLVKRHAVKKYSPLIQKAIIRIESDLTCDLSLSAIAKHNNVSPNYFSVIFKKETGQTLTEYVISKRIAYAKLLLKNTNLQIQTVAQHCGILDFHYFCRIFKRATGITPTQYRNSII